MCYYTSEVSCPYFYPVQAQSQDTARTALLPLGGFWAGVCHAISGQVAPPDEALLRVCCHLGYARGQCARFPTDDAGADAVRFTVSRDNGGSLVLLYVLERNHHPFAHGPMEYSFAAARFVQSPPGEIVCRQAEAYVESYLRRKREAGPRCAEVIEPCWKANR